MLMLRNCGVGYSTGSEACQVHVGGWRESDTTRLTARCKTPELHPVSRVHLPFLRTAAASGHQTGLLYVNYGTGHLQTASRNSPFSLRTAKHLLSS